MRARWTARCAAGALSLLASTAAASGPENEVGLVAGWTRYSQFDDGLPGFGLTLSRRLRPWLAAEARFGLSPWDLGEPAFSASRLEGFLGLRGGPRLGRHQAFGALRAGLVRLAEAPAPVFCLAIYPPTLECALAGGETLLGLELGAGFEAVFSERGVARLEAGSQLVRYPGPAMGEGRRVFLDALWSHNPRVGISAGLRF
jgi:hypothetical protein